MFPSAKENTTSGPAADSGTSIGPPSIEALAPWLERLDRRLAAALARAQEIYADGPERDPYRGMYVNQGDVEQALASPPGHPRLHLAPEDPPQARGPLARLARSFGLDGFDLDVLVLALAPEIDLRYERIFGFLNDDVTQRRPTFDLALDLCCSSAAERIARRSRFSSRGPLVQAGLLELVSFRSEPQTPLLAHALVLDGIVSSFLLGETGLDPRIAAWCELTQPGSDEPPMHATERALFERLTARVARGDPRTCVHVLQVQGGGARAVADRLARAAELPVLVVHANETPEPSSDTWSTLFRHASVHSAVVLVEGADELREGPGKPGLPSLFRLAKACPAPVVFASSGRKRPSHGAGIVQLRLSLPEVAERKAVWEDGLRTHGVASVRQVASRLARAVCLTPQRIRDAIEAAAARTDLDREREIEAVLLDAARNQFGNELASLAVELVPSHDWDDLQLPSDVKEQLQHIADRLRLRERVWHEWGFSERQTRGRGEVVLFSGPSGSGKTAAAEALTRQLPGRGLFRVDLSSVVSKYIGETEKNLERIFNAARDAQCVLLFDESDALFGKRSEVVDSHDRYANMEIGYLLQKVEEPELEGLLCILTTNMRSQLDEAMLRRLSAVVHFPFPDQPSRERIWRRIWPDRVPLLELDYGRLARFTLTGGNIRNVALAAAFQAALTDEPVSMTHVLAATRAEFHKLGALTEDADFADDPDPGSSGV